MPSLSPSVLICRPERVRVYQADTDRIKSGAGTGGSSSISLSVAFLSTGATKKVSAEQIKQIAAAALEAATGDLEIVDGSVRIAGTDRVISFVDLAAHPMASTDKLRAEEEFSVEPPTYPNGTHIAEVEVDPDTGATHIMRYVVVDDFGATLNPLLLEGQVHGGAVQGIGQALMEDTVYDSSTGQLLSASLMDYAMPRAHHAPDFVFETRNVPCKTNRSASKALVKRAPSVAPGHHECDHRCTLASHRVRHIDMPATPRRIWEAINTAQKSPIC